MRTLSLNESLGSCLRISEEMKVCIRWVVDADNAMDNVKAYTMCRLSWVDGPVGQSTVALLPSRGNTTLL
jgi:hypothetical protein